MAEYLERILSAGPLSRETAYRLVVHGDVGSEELEILISKLRIDRDVLARAEALDRINKEKQEQENPPLSAN